MKVRKEVHIRRSFAEEQGKKWYKTMQHSLNSGNIFTCRAAYKYLQARRIYVHYCNEYQLNQNLPLTH